MLVNTAEQNTVFISDSKQTHVMDVSNSSSIFQLLSERLYKKPEEAAFREITTNAWDSHIASGVTDTPIQINFDSGSVTIKDFGEGIPHEEFLSLYGSLGGSSKRNDERLTGGMGIGKLAPLAIVDSFIVSNCHAGICKTYSISKGTIDTNGAHTVDLLLESSTEDTGLSVTFALTKWDPEKSKDLLIRNNISADIHYSGTVEEIRKVDADIRVVSCPWASSYTGSFYILWGNNSYFVDSSLRSVVNKKIREDIKEWASFNSVSFVVKFEGRLDITPNREEMIESEATKKAVRHCAQKLVEALQKGKKASVLRLAEENKNTDNWYVQYPKYSYFGTDTKYQENHSSLEKFLQHSYYNPYGNKKLSNIYSVHVVGKDLAPLYQSSKRYLPFEKNKTFRKLGVLLEEYATAVTKRMDPDKKLEFLFTNKIGVNAPASFTGIKLHTLKKVDQDEFLRKLREIIPKQIKVVYHSHKEKKAATKANKRPAMGFYRASDFADNKYDAELDTKPVAYFSSRYTALYSYMLSVPDEFYEKYFEDKVKKDLLKDAVVVRYEDELKNIQRRKNVEGLNIHWAMAKLISEQSEDFKDLMLFYKEDFKVVEFKNTEDSAYNILRGMRGKSKVILTDDEVTLLSGVSPLLISHCSVYPNYPSFRFLDLGKFGKLGDSQLLVSLMESSSEVRDEIAKLLGVKEVPKLTGVKNDNEQI